LILIILQRLSLIRDIAINSDNRALSVFHLNIRSLNSSWRSLCKFLELLNFKFDVIVLTEICAYNITYYHSIVGSRACTKRTCHLKLSKSPSTILSRESTVCLTSPILTGHKSAKIAKTCYTATNCPQHGGT